MWGSGCACRLEDTQAAVDHETLVEDRLALQGGGNPSQPVRRQSDSGQPAACGRCSSPLCPINESHMNAQGAIMLYTRPEKPPEAIETPKGHRGP